MKCGGKHENVKLQIRDYFLKENMFPIEMGGCDVIFRDEWLWTLGLITMEFKELCTIFIKEDHKHTLEGLQSISPKMIISHHMENLLK